ncbi:MAG: radical SAM family heme chaperone HemW [Eubacteriales bacterium]|nr:radical SAM family heme chaperone HemW [Eubacteriales bacterium]
MELYVHIPFCIRKCNYCDFLSFPSCEEEREAYVEALCQEIIESGKMALDQKLRSIFIGGGTPSILTIGQMRRILSCVRENFQMEEQIEISMEANPGTLNEEKLKAYHDMGINRLSIGLQSTEDDCLKMLGRIHNFDQFKENYQWAREAGFQNVNIDIMSALPGQTISSYKKTLETVLAFEPEHISSYSLILEEGTPFYEDDNLIAQLPDEDSERTMYEMTQELLMQKGYHRYEISNYSKEGKECIHNLGYWDDVPYLGVGLGASSYWRGCRFSNERDLSTYIKKPFIPPEEREDFQKLSLEEKMEEYMFLGLRKRSGVSISGFSQKYGVSMEEIFGKVIDRYKKIKLLEEKEDRLYLTDAGIDVSNHIFCEFLIK